MNVNSKPVSTTVNHVRCCACGTTDEYHLCFCLSLPAQNVSLSRADKLRREKENGKATEEVVHA